MKRIFVLITCVAFLVCALALSVSAAEVTASGSIGTNVTYTITDNGVLTISGTGATNNYGTGGSPFYNNTDVTRIVIEDGVTQLGYYLFNGMSNVTDITFPSTLTTIGRNCFTGMSSLTKLVLPVGLQSIEMRAFANCTGLTDVSIPSTVSTIASYAFLGCTNLESVLLFNDNPTNYDPNFVPTGIDSVVYIHSNAYNAYSSISGWLTRWNGKILSIGLYLGSFNLLTNVPDGVVSYSQGNEAVLYVYTENKPLGDVSVTWFSCDADGENRISVGNSIYYYPSTDTIGTFYYRALCNETIYGESGGKFTPVIQVNVVEPPQAPVFTTNFTSTPREIPQYGSGALVIYPESSNGDLTVQWYVNDTASNTGGTLLDTGSADNWMFTIPTKIPGIFYYYAVVSNTVGGLSSTATTDVQQVIVLEAGPGQYDDKLDDIQGSLDDTNTKLDDANNKLDDTNNKLDDANNKLDDIVSGEVTPSQPEGGDKVGELDDMEQSIRDDVSTGLDDAEEVQKSALEVFVEYASAFAVVSWIFSIFVEIPFFKSLLYVSLALGVFVVMLGVVPNVVNRFSYKAGKE